MYYTRQIFFVYGNRENSLKNCRIMFNAPETEIFFFRIFDPPQSTSFSTLVRNKILFSHIYIHNIPKFIIYIYILCCRIFPSILDSTIGERHWSKGRLNEKIKITRIYYYMHLENIMPPVAVLSKRWAVGKSLIRHSNTRGRHPLHLAHRPADCLTEETIVRGRFEKTIVKTIVYDGRNSQYTHNCSHIDINILQYLLDVLI